MSRVGSAHDVCADCLTTTGKLCPRCARSVLPQLARNIGWLKLMGEATVEQTRLQAIEANAVAVEKAKRREDRKLRRSGIRGLALSIIGSRVALPPADNEVEEISFDHRNYPDAA